MRTLLLFAILLSTTIVQAYEPGRSVCEKYLALDEELQCNRSGYLIDFGYRYCAQFENTEYRYTPNGRAVLKKLRTCLIESLDHTFDITCQNVKDVALATHIGCYVENGFCELSMQDKLRIVWTVKAETQKKSFRKTMREILQACGPRAILPAQKN